MGMSGSIYHDLVEANRKHAIRQYLEPLLRRRLGGAVHTAGLAGLQSLSTDELLDLLLEVSDATTPAAALAALRGALGRGM
jgi:hypothetical protein